MDTNKWRPSQVGEAAMDAPDWRSQLQADSRQRIVNKIMATLKRHLPFCGQDGLQELSKIAVRFEEKIYAEATSQSDYLRKISLEMLTMETKSQNSMGNPLQSNSAGNSNGPPDPGSFGMQPQVPNQGMQPQVPSQASLDSSAQTGYANGGDWLEEIYQKMQQMGLQQQSNPLQRDMQQRLQASGQISGTMLHAQNLMDQQKQLYQSQRPLLETSSTSLDSSAQTGDWQEEVYQKIKVMKKRYLPELSEIYQIIATKVQQHDSLPQQPRSEQLEKLKMFKTMLEHLMSVLQISKSNISPGLKEKLGLYEKQIVNFVNVYGPGKQGPPLQQGQLPPPLM